MDRKMIQQEKEAEDYGYALLGGAVGTVTKKL
jgi:hypothetical protein